jgi:osmotically inducible lipoprotein OsmB
MAACPVGLDLAGRGYNCGDRALSGGLISAGGGVAAVTGGSPLAGAAIGGALTSGHDVNLGRPIWN